MKFKKIKNGDSHYKRLAIINRGGEALEVQTRIDGKPGLFVFMNDGSSIELTESKALKLAWAIIDELDPIGEWATKVFLT